MSKASDAYDALKARVAAVLPSHFVLPNPYAPEQNSELALKQGQGVKMLGAINSNRSLSCQLSLRRGVEVVITRKYFGSEMMTSNKSSIEKALFEDQYLIIKEIEKDPTIALTSVVVQTRFESDSGIEFVFNDDKPFLMIRSLFTLEYIENLY
jgi:hypothetical protein